MKSGTPILLLILVGAVHVSFAQQTVVQQRSAASNLQTIVSNWLGDAAPDAPNKCGLPALAHALEHQTTLSANARTALGELLARPVLQKSKLIGSFRIHYDTTGTNEPALLDANHVRIPGTAERYADSVGAIMNYALSFETGTLGYLPPPSDNGVGGGPEYDIYIQNLGGSAYGFTTPETPINNKPDGGTYTSFITIDHEFSFVFPDSNKGLPALRVTLAHEIHHAIQMGNYGFWTGDIFFYEITSVWMEDVVYTEVNDYYQYLRSSMGQFRRPDISFVANDYSMYSRGIWCHYLAKRFDRDVVRHCWEQIRNARPLPAMDAALAQQPYVTALRSAFVEWTQWNLRTGDLSDSVLYYPEGRFYPSVVQTPVNFSGMASRSVAGSLQPYSSRYYDVQTPTERFTVPLTNLNVEAALNSSSSQLGYTLLLDTRQVDDSYSKVGRAVFARLDVTDPTNWYFPKLSSSLQPYPNPFRADGKTVVSFPLDAVSPVQGKLSIFSVSMDLVYSSGVVSTASFNQQVFSWNGKRDDGEVAGSGIYVYVLEYGGQESVGKFALVRK